MRSRYARLAPAPLPLLRPPLLLAVRAELGERLDSDRPLYGLRYLSASRSERRPRRRRPLLDRALPLESKGLKFQNGSTDTQTMKRLDNTPKHFTPDAADKAIAELTAGDPDWTYTVNADPSGKSPWVRIEITDEDGEFVAFVS